MNDLEIRDRIVDIMETERISRNLSIAGMARLMNIDESVYKRLVYKQTAKVSLSVAIKLCELTGKPFDDLIRKSGGSEIAQKYALLSARQKEYINALISLESEFNARSDAGEYLSVLVPTGNMADGMILDTASVIKVQATAEMRKFPQVTCGIKITSNNLLPAYCMNDILLICCEPVRHGDTGVFIDAESGCAYIRKFLQGKECVLEPINNFGRPFTVDPSDPDDMSKWIKFGYVISKMRS